MANKQPRTQREIKKAKEAKRERDLKTVIVYNISKQTIPLQLTPPTGVDFYAGQQSIPLSRGKSTRLPQSRVMMEQLTNLQKSGQIRLEMLEG